MISVLILILGYSRYLLARKRNISLNDSLLTSYGAESKINDLLMRLRSGYLTSEDFPLDWSTSGEGTEFHIEGSETGDGQVVTVTANRSYAASGVRATRFLASEQGVGEVEVVLSIDCTESMKESSGMAGTTRLEELKKAVILFLDNIEEYGIADSFHLGVEAFQYNVAWLRTADGREIKPNSGITIPEIRQAIEEGIERFPADSPACSYTYGHTSVGSGFMFANIYFRDNPPVSPLAKRIEILITDGRPNSRIPYDRCPPSYFCPSDRGHCDSEVNNPEHWLCSPSVSGCLPYAIDFVRCTLADTNTLWKGTNYGDRDPSVDAYVVTVFESPIPEIENVFADYATHYYPIEYAYQLSDAFEEIFGEVVEDLSKITIERIIPGSE